MAVVRGWFDARRRGREGVFEFLSPDLEWTTRWYLPDSQTYYGHEGHRALQERFREVIDDLWFEADEFISVGDQVLVPVRWGGRGRGSGVTVEECAEAWVFTVRGGLITRVTEYDTKEAAREALQR